LSNGGEAWIQLHVTLVRDGEGRPLYFITQIQDIVDEKNSAAMLDATFEASADMLCVADLNGFLIRVNPAWTHVLGWTPDDLTSRPLIEFVHPQDVEATKAQFVDTAESHSGAVAFENRYLAKDGKYRWLQWSAYTLKDKGWVIANARDVTDQTLLAADLLRSNMELTNFGAVISHDLKSPLTSVTGFADLLNNELLQRGDKELASLADTVFRSALRMAALTDGILAHSQAGALDHDSKTQVDLVELSQAVVNDLAAAVKAGHATVQIESPLPSVFGDPVALRQVLQNLVDNALKFGRPGVDLQIAIRARRTDGKWMLGVVDNGLGMSESDQQNAFEPFRQGDAGRSRSGVGLGLATCRRLVEHGGGEIVVESELGEGTAVWFSIPDTPKAAPPHDLVVSST